MIGRINPHFAVALKEIRTAATVACWLIGLALAAQVIAWALLSMTDIRFVDLDRTAAAIANQDPTVLSANDVDAARPTSIGAVAEESQTANVNRQLSAYDRWLASLTNLAATLGTMGAIALIPLIGLGVVLAAGAATEGVQKTSGAFVWAVVLMLLSIPWSVVFEHVPFMGMFTTYATLAADVESYRGLESPVSGPSFTRSILFYGRHCMLPLAALAGVTAIAIRFRAGVEDGLFPKEDYRLDPELEREVARIRATSLVGGGRSAGALRGVVNDSAENAPDDDASQADDESNSKRTKRQKRSAPDDTTRSIMQPSPGDGLRRPI